VTVAMTIATKVRVAWPLDAHHEQLVRELASVVARGGGWRLARGPVVSGSRDDYPDAYDATAAAIAKVVARTLWHAHLDIATTIDDVRRPESRGRQRLRRTELELAEVTDRGAQLTLSSIGNDDVGGLVSHEVGRLFVAHLSRTGHPFRTRDDGLPDPELGSIATVCLGLGVIAANAAHYDRSAGEMVGRTSYHEHEIVQIGGLAWEDLSFLLAVQQTVRDDVLGLESLRPSQRERVLAWIDALDDHEEELVAMLGLGDLDGEEPPRRGAEPAPVAVTSAYSETDLMKANTGLQTLRRREGRGSAYAVMFALLGAILGIPGSIGIAWWFFVASSLVMGLGGYLFGRKRHYLRCGGCWAYIKPADSQCKVCGGTLVDQLVLSQAELDAEAELERAALEAGESS